MEHGEDLTPRIDEQGRVLPIVVIRLPEPTETGRTCALIAGHRRVAAARRLGWEKIRVEVVK